MSLPTWIADVRIVSSAGGEVSSYLRLFATVRQSGERVIIDGPCLSACTLVLSTIPQDRICVTSRARLGFHAAWRAAAGSRKVAAADGTELLMEIYPQQIRSWIAQHGGLTPQVIYLRGRKLASMYQFCA